MTLPASGALAFSQIQTEFGGTNPISMSEYYAGGGMVPVGTIGVLGAIPSLGTLKVGHFRGNYIDTISAGRLTATGYNFNGLLGDGTTTYKSSPVQVGALTTWTLTASGNHALSIKSDGTLWAWGHNTSGQLGQNDKVPRSSPIQVGSASDWKHVVCTNSASLALKTNNTLWVSGGGSGEIGLGAIGAVSSFTQLGTNTWIDVQAGDGFAAAVRSDGTLWCWGYNNHGQLGIGTSNPTANNSSPTQVGALTNWSTISCGMDFVIATKTDNTVWAWGSNIYGEYGNGASGYHRSSPVQVSGFTNWKRIVCARNNTFMLDTSGTLWATGLGTVGNLGDNTAVSKSTPVQIGASGIWKRLATNLTGGQNGAAIKTDGTLWVWGANSYGQLGFGDITNRSTPTQFGTSSTWQQVTIGKALFAIST